MNAACKAQYMLRKMFETCLTFQLNEQKSCTIYLTSDTKKQILNFLNIDKYCSEVHRVPIFYSN